MPDCQKKKINQDQIKECVKKVVAAYHQELLKEPGTHCGLGAIVEYHVINKDTPAQAVHDMERSQAFNPEAGKH